MRIELRTRGETHRVTLPTLPHEICMLTRRRSTVEAAPSKLTGLVLIVSLCAFSLPIPMGTVNSSGKDRTQPFPCQNRPCGCASAEQCWKQCCCFTNTEKLAWAREHDITPPDFVVAAANAEESAKRAKAHQEPPKVCQACTSQGSSASCRTSRRRQNCCSKTSDRRSPSDEADLSKKGSDQDRCVIALEMMKCHGQGVFGNSLPWAVVPVVDVPHFTTTPQTWEHPHSTRVVSRVAEPPEPPPRLA